MFKEFKEFALKGSVVDLAIGIVIGGAFGLIVGSFVADVLMPPIGLLLGKVDFSNMYAILSLPDGASGTFASLADAQKAGAVTLNYGKFINTIINFLIIAFAVFLVVKQINRCRKAEVTTKDCPFCLSAVPLKATKCGHCTSELPAA